MCDFCTTDCVNIGEVIPGWNLVLVAKTSRDAKQGDFGLSSGEDIEFFWTDEPAEEPCKGCSNEQLSAEDEFARSQHYDTVDRLERHFVCPPEVGARLYSACKEAGYDPKANGSAVLYWLFDRMGVVYKKWKETDGDMTKIVKHQKV